MEVLNKFNEYSLLPLNYCECSYLTSIIDILKNQLSDNYSIQIIHPNANIIKNSSRKYNIAIHISNEEFFDNSHYDYFDFIFRFYLSDKCDYKKIFPINIGYNSSGYKNIKLGFNADIEYDRREIDTFFYGNKVVRKDFFKSVQKFSTEFDIKFTNRFKDGLGIVDFREKLAHSKICLAPGGVSPETFRYTEAFASGCIVITDFFSDVWYMKDSPSIFINNWKNFSQEHIQDILCFIHLGEYRERALQYYETKLSPKANAYYILNVLTNKT